MIAWILLACLIWAIVIRAGWTVARDATRHVCPQCEEAGDDCHCDCEAVHLPAEPDVHVPAGWEVTRPDGTPCPEGSRCPSVNWKA